MVNQITHGEGGYLTYKCLSCDIYLVASTDECVHNDYEVSYDLTDAMALVDIHSVVEG
jgi:hypothetical protein